MDVILNCGLCGENYHSEKFLEHLNAHENNVNNLISNTHVVYSLDLVIGQFLVTHSELASQMKAAGVSMVFIPTIKVTRFGSNMFMIGFIDFEIDCIEIYRPDKLFPLKLMPWFL